MEEKADIVILGGGINGCAIARKLSLEGKKVCLLERNTIGSGTSSNSSKLIHGGLRYLETGKIGLVKESLKDRKRLAELYPNLVHMVPFYLPIYEDSLRPWWVMRTGLGLYDLLSSQPEYHCRHVNNEEFLKRFPRIRPEGLQRVYVYYDGKTDDLQITRQIARDAYDSGCTVRENCQVVLIDGSDKAVRVLYQDRSGRHEVEAPVLINATGPWIDEVNAAYYLPHNYRISKVSGIHIVINQALVPDCMFLQTDNRRIFFMIPWGEDRTIVGTTERTEDCSCSEVKVQEDDVDYLLDCANHYLREPVGHDDICDTFLGIRPLVMDKRDDVGNNLGTGPKLLGGKYRGAGRNNVAATNMSREYKIDVIRKRDTELIHVYGGKLTTCLSMAEKVAGMV